MSEDFRTNPSYKKGLYINDFYVEHGVDRSVKNSEYLLHNHDEHEILLFVSGNSQFNIEGTIYNLKPYDIVIASSEELHRIVHKSSERYERYIVAIIPEFLDNNICAAYEEIFNNNNTENNYIDANVAIGTGMVDLIMKIHKYSEAGEFSVAKGVIVELLYLLKLQMNKQNDYGISSPYVKEIVRYINEHISENLTLDRLSEIFNISSVHICRLFKKHMKMTVREYVTYKRLMFVRTLCRSGKSIMEASIEAGFSDYSSFYRRYVEYFKKPPREDMNFKSKLLIDKTAECFLEE